ncbi:MAG TPA: hypothetical protein VLL95_02100, partial [Phnomibacter sp.]|nr:hypothetical protein [Phnomibacter sp.]
MNHSTWRQRLTYISHFIPVRLYLLLFLAASAIALWWVNRQYPAEPSLGGSLLQLLVKASIAAALLLLLLSFLSVFIPFAWFAWKVYRRQVQVAIDNAEEAGKKEI